MRAQDCCLPPPFSPLSTFTYSHYCRHLPPVYEVYLVQAQAAQHLLRQFFRFLCLPQLKTTMLITIWTYELDREAWIVPLLLIQCPVSHVSNDHGTIRGLSLIYSWTYVYPNQSQSSFVPEIAAAPITQINLYYGHTRIDSKKVEIVLPWRSCVEVVKELAFHYKN